MANLVGCQLERYVLDRELGRGGLSIVYLAHDTETGQSVAVKVLLPHMAADRTAVERFREGGVLGASIQQQNVVRVYRVGQDQGLPFIAMEYLPGGTLERQLNGKPWPLKQVLAVLREVAAALDSVHARGIFHRDIKPSNILFSADGSRAVLSDFGIAQSISRPGPAKRGDRSGTELYMSPEQWQGGAATPASDIYSLAVMAYQMLTGRLPFFAEAPLALMFQHVRKPPPSPRRFNRSLPLASEQALLRGLAKHPADRFRTAADFVAALGGERPAVTPGPRVLPSSKPARRWQFSPWSFVAGLLLIASAAGFFWWARQGFLQPRDTPTSIVVTRITPVTATPQPTAAPTMTFAPSSTPAPMSALALAPQPALMTRSLPTASPPPAETATPDLPLPVCPYPDVARILSPRQGEEVSGPLTLMGTAAGPSFESYELMYLPDGVGGDPTRYQSSAFFQQVRNGKLGVWDPGALGLKGGRYRLFLRVVDRQKAYRECTVIVKVK